MAQLPMNRAALLLVVLLSLACAGPARAWGALGHRLVGELAERHLQPATRHAVQALLAGESRPTLAGVASWADGLRYDAPARFRQTSRWHYLDLTDACAYDPARDCADGQCAVAALQRQQRILGDRRQPLAARRDALKFIVHLVADLHQPLHVGHRPDRGGNRFQVSLRVPPPPRGYAHDHYADGAIGTSLHAIWDHDLLDSAHLGTNAYAARLDAQPWPPARVPVANPVLWADESCRLTDAPGLYPTAHVLDRRYLDRERPLAEQRIRAAAYRLAALLDATLATSVR
jgi:nuclease S1